MATVTYLVQGCCVHIRVVCVHARVCFSFFGLSIYSKTSELRTICDHGFLPTDMSVCYRL